ncbi:MAG: 60S ribosomal protein L31 [Candidatus Aenigmarchaeota archaeon]|nr:60S ribosomal protein L31 [Candidatus Aenigmarchaeota archaeon]
MAEKKSDIDRVYTINLRKSWVNYSRSRRTKKSINTIREFLQKHTKSAEVKLSKGINEFVMSRGFRKPPGKISIEVKGDFASVQAKLPGEVIAKKTQEKKGGIAGLRDRLSGKESPVTKEDLKKAVEEKVAEETTEEKVKEIAKKVEEREKKETADKSTEVKKEAAKPEEKKETPKKEPKKETTGKNTPKASKEEKK